MNFSYLTFLTIIFDKNGKLENCYRTANWAPYNDLAELRDKNKASYRLLHNDEILFLIYPYADCVGTGCQFGYNTLGSIAIPRSDRSLYFESYLRLDRKLKFKKCTIREFFDLDFRYNFDATGKLFPTKQWVNHMLQASSYSNMEENFIIMPLQWFYDARSIVLYKNRLKAYFYGSNGAFDSHSLPIKSLLDPTFTNDEFVFVEIQNNPKYEL